MPSYTAAALAKREIERKPNAPASHRRIDLLIDTAVELLFAPRPRSSRISHGRDEQRRHYRESLALLRAAAAAERLPALKCQSHDPIIVLDRLRRNETVASDRAFQEALRKAHS